MLKKCLQICGLLVAISLVGCAYFQSDEPEAVWKPDVYAGDQLRAAIVRGGDESERVVKCDSKEIANYICMHRDDVEHMFKVCLESKK